MCETASLTNVVSAVLRDKGTNKWVEFLLL